MERGVKAQMKYADKLGAAFSVIIGDNELENGTAQLKNMKTGETIELPIDDSFTTRFTDIRTADMIAE